MTAPRNAFGVQPRPIAPREEALARAGWDRVLAELDRLGQQAAREAALACASGRWQPGRPDPDRYVPGDVVALRAFAVAAELARAAAEQGAILSPVGGGTDADSDARIAAVHRTLHAVADVSALFEAVPHFLEADDALALIGSRGIDHQALTEVRLPHPRVAVYFSRTLELRPEHYDWPRAWDDGQDLDGNRLDTRSALGDLRATGGGIDGAVLTEAENGGLGDEVLWLVSANPDPSRPGPMALDRYRAVVWGRLSAAGLAPLAHRLGAAVAWADWRSPGRSLELPEDPRSPAFRRAVRRGAFRRSEPRGALADVRVLDLRPAAPPAARREPAPAPVFRSSPSTHLRRAHWRLARVGPEGAERRLVRVAATVVNPGATPLTPTVYRLPRLEDMPEPPATETVIDLRDADLPSPRPQGAARPRTPEVTP